MIQVLNKMKRKDQENYAIGEAINETHSGVVPTEGSTRKAELLERKPCNKRVLDMLRKHLRIPVVTSPKPKKVKVSK